MILLQLKTLKINLNLKDKMINKVESNKGRHSLLTSDLYKHIHEHEPEPESKESITQSHTCAHREQSFNFKRSALKPYIYKQH